MGEECNRGAASAGEKEGGQDRWPALVSPEIGSYLLTVFTLLQVKPGNLLWFRQGAQRVWDEQELQWEEERKSRGLLMTEVDWFQIQKICFLSCWEFNMIGLLVKRCFQSERSSWRRRPRRTVRLRRSAGGDGQSWSKSWTDRDLRSHNLAQRTEIY